MHTLKVKPHADTPLQIRLEKLSLMRPYPRGTCHQANFAANYR
jgi:hypothetical protein